MIRIYSFEPRYFDNNGDQGNIEVIERLLRAQGVEVERTASVEFADFVLLGDCSIAVLEKFKFQLQELLPALRSRLATGSPTLIVGRTYEYLAPLLGISLNVGERTSAFLEVQTDFGLLWGYHNSEVLEPRVFSKGLFMGTTLFGPLLAKNPELTSAVCKGFGIELSSTVYERAVQLAQLAKTNTTFG